MARKRASMREGPLAELFRATEAAQKQAAEGKTEVQPAPIEPQEETVEHAPPFEVIEEPPVPEHERAVLNRLKRDEATQLDDLIESLEGTLGSAEIFTALFELELRGRIRQMPGKNYVRCF